MSHNLSLHGSIVGHVDEIAVAILRHQTWNLFAIIVVSTQRRKQHLTTCFWSRTRTIHHQHRRKSITEIGIWLAAATTRSFFHSLPLYFRLVTPLIKKTMQYLYPNTRTANLSVVYRKTVGSPNSTPDFQANAISFLQQMTENPSQLQKLVFLLFSPPCMICKS